MKAECWIQAYAGDVQSLRGLVCIVYRRHFVWIAFTALFCLLASGGTLAVETQADRQISASISDADRQSLRDLVDKDFAEFRSNARYWSFAYHLFLFGGAALSALAALVLKLEGAFDVRKRNNWGAILAAASALMVTIMTSGGFQRKWEANRLAAFEVRNLQLELEKEEANKDAILDRLMLINNVRNQVIVGVTASDVLKTTGEGRSADADK